MKDADQQIIALLNQIKALSGGGSGAAWGAITGTLSAQTDLQAALDAKPGYKVYTALLTQSGTDAPVATVLQNTLGGTVAWEYSATGSYAGVLTGAFANVVVPVPIIINYITGGGTVLHVVTTEKGSADSIIVHSYSDSGATLADSELGANGPTYIEVRVPTP